MNRRHFLIASLCASALPGRAARASAAEGWPRRLANADGSATELPAPPARVLSSSVTLSGSLLAIGAPLIGSATTAHGGFFAQWQAVAETRGVEKLWPAGSVDLEAVWALAPDLIVVSAGGADSALAHRQALAEVAPVLVLDYGALDWQELSGSAAGRC